MRMRIIRCKSLNILIICYNNIRMIKIIHMKLINIDNIDNMNNKLNIWKLLILIKIEVTIINIIKMAMAMTKLTIQMLLTK